VSSRITGAGAHPGPPGAATGGCSPPGAGRSSPGGDPRSDRWCRRAVDVIEAAVVVSGTSKDRLVRSQMIVAHETGQDRGFGAAVTASLLLFCAAGVLCSCGRPWPRGPVAASGTWSR